MDIAHLHQPFTTTLNPATHATFDQAFAWAVAHGILHQADWARLQAAAIPQLIGLAYPLASAELLVPLHQFNLCIMLLEQVTSEQATTTQAVRALLDQLMAVVTQNACPSHALLAAVRAVIAPVQPSIGFHMVMREMCDAWVWEAHNRETRTIPSLDAYIRYRPSTVGVMPYQAFYHVLATEAGYAYPETEVSAAFPAWLSGPGFQSLPMLAMQYSAAIIADANDVMSFEKEQRDGDPHNRVTILMHHHHVTRDVAMAMVIQRHNRLVQEFAGFARQYGLRSWPMRHWIAANMAWGAITSRYTQTPRGDKPRS